MTLITMCTVFVFCSIWNLAVLLTIIEFMAKSKPLKVTDFIWILLSLAVWFCSGVYLFGL